MVLACKKSGASEFIERLQNRYGAFVEEAGSNFSGGERQRIAIARAMITKPDIYIFYEATSNLDSFSEKRIQHLIFGQRSDKTVIIIAHRLSTITACYYICFIENGRVIEIGTLEELMYLDGGVNWSKAKSFALGFITAGVSTIAGKAISKSAVGAVMNSAAGWLAGAIDSAILWCWYNPWLAAGVAVAFAGTVVGIYYLGKKKHKW